MLKHLWEARNFSCVRLHYEKTYNHLKEIRDRATDEGTKYGLSVAMAALYEVPQSVSKEDIVLCSECKFKDDCERRVTIATRNHILEKNEYQYLKLDFCSKGMKNNEKNSENME